MSTEIRIGQWRICGFDRSVALFCDRSVSLIADDEDACCGFNDVVGDGVELVDL